MIKSTMKKSEDNNSNKYSDDSKMSLSRRDFFQSSIVAAASTIVLAKRVEAQQVTDPIQNKEKALIQGSKVLIHLNVNGKTYATFVEPRDMLVNVLRENLGLTGTKRPCNRMECGGCTVLIDDKPYYSCTYLAIRAEGKKILTVEGWQSEKILQALHTAWHENDASQCGYCQEGQLMSATALLKSNPNPSVDEIKIAMSGNLCRCGTYMNIIEAIQSASKKLKGV
jgi:aerobic-type carbon monoxide dehydrogenase small subunit (CoxS/CutS family)